MRIQKFLHQFATETLVTFAHVETVQTVERIVETVQTVERIVETVDVIENFYESVEIVENPIFFYARACVHQTPPLPYP